MQVRVYLQGLNLGGRTEGTKHDAVAALVRLFLGLLFQKATGQKPRAAQRQSSCVIIWNAGLLDKGVCFVCAAFGVYRFTKQGLYLAVIVFT